MTVADFRRTTYTRWRLVFRVHRFEFASAVAFAAVVAGAAIWATLNLQRVQVSNECLLRWVASVPTTPDCADKVALWAGANDSMAARVMAAMVLLPAVVGLLAGVPLVARELESGTAAFSWSLSASRRRWLVRQCVPAFALVLAASTLAGACSWWLATTRSGGGAWTSTFGDADLFGFPVPARAIAAMMIGLATGVVLGRVLPTLIVSVILTAGLFFAVAAIQPLVVNSTLNQTDVGSPKAAAALIQANADFDIRFVTPDERILSLEQARLNAPTGVDPDEWIAANYRPVQLGVRASKTGEWQAIETMLFLATAGLTYLLASELVQRRSPR